MLDNKTLRINHFSEQYVILSKRDDVDKYVSRDYLKKHAFQYTVCLNRAKRFQSEKQAYKAIELLEIEENSKVVPVMIEMKAEV